MKYSIVVSVDDNVLLLDKPLKNDIYGAFKFWVPRNDNWTGIVHIAEYGFLIPGRGKASGCILELNPRESVKDYMKIGTIVTNIATEARAVDKAEVYDVLRRFAGHPDSQESRR